MRQVRRISLFLLLVLISAVDAEAKRGQVVVYVQDKNDHPVSHLQIGIQGIGDAKLTADDGIAILAVGEDTSVGDWLTLSIIRSPAGRDFVMVSPWDQRAEVPSFEEKPENRIKVVVVQSGDKAALTNGTVVRALTENILKRSRPNQDPNASVSSDQTVSLSTVATQYGLTASEVDQAIRAWGLKATDPYDAGLAALYERDYPKASSRLEDSFELRKREWEENEQKATLSRKQAADAAFYLGQSRYLQGKYRDSVDAFQECRAIYGSDDPALLDNWAMSLIATGEYADAENKLVAAIVIYHLDESQFQQVIDPSQKAAVLSNLGIVFEDESKFKDAEAPLKEALDLAKQALGPDDPRVAQYYGNYGTALEDNGDTAGAEKLYRKAVELDKKAISPNPGLVSTHLNNLAKILKGNNDFTTAEAMYRDSIDILTKNFGPDYPPLASGHMNLGALERDRGRKGDYEAAAADFSEALRIATVSLGPDHPIVAMVLFNQAILYEKLQEPWIAEVTLWRAEYIAAKKLPPDAKELLKIRDELKPLTSN